MILNISLVVLVLSENMLFSFEKSIFKFEALLSPTVARGVFDAFWPYGATEQVIYILDFRIRRNLHQTETLSYHNL